MVRTILTVSLLISSILFAEESDNKNIIQLEDKTVTSTRRATDVKDAPDITILVTSKDMELMKARDVSDILDQLPGVSTEGGSGGGLPFKKTVTINGMPVLYSVIMVDGTRILSSHIHTGVNVNVVPVEHIKRIELIKGAASAQYGSDAMGGILNIITKKGGSKPEVNLSGRMGTESAWQSGLSATGPAGDKVRYSIYTGWEQSDGLPIKEPASRKDAFSYKKLHIIDRLDVTLTRKLKGHISVNYLKTAAPFSSTTSLPFTDSNAGIDTALSVKKTSDLHAYLLTPKADLHYEISKNLRMDASIYYTRWENEKNSELNEITSPEVTLGYSAPADNYLLFGIDYQYRNFSRKRVAENDQNVWGVFIQDEYSPVKQLSLLGALRFDIVELPDEDAVTVVSPKISALYCPLEALRLRLSVGRGFRAPNVQDLYETLYGHADDMHFRAGNQDLKPEYSTNLTGGIEWDPLKTFTIMVNGYYNIIHDMITPVDRDLQNPDELFPGISSDLGLDNEQVYVYQRQNIHEAMVTGGEIRGIWNIFKQYKLNLGYSLVHNENKSTGKTLPYYPGQSAFGTLTFVQPAGQMLELNGFLGIHARIERSIWKYKENGRQHVELDNYQKLDMGLGLLIAGKYEIYGSVYNLLGQEMHMYEDKELRTEGDLLIEAGIRVKAF